MDLISKSLFKWSTEISGRLNTPAKEEKWKRYIKKLLHPLLFALACKLLAWLPNKENAAVKKWMVAIPSQEQVTCCSRTTCSDWTSFRSLQLLLWPDCWNLKAMFLAIWMWGRHANDSVNFETDIISLEKKEVSSDILFHLFGCVVFPSRLSLTFLDN